MRTVNSGRRAQRALTGLALLVGLVGCLQPVAEDPDNGGGFVADIGAGGGDAVGADQVAGQDSEDVGQDLLPAACNPICSLWQVCVDGSCTPKPCQKDAECNEDPLPAGTEPHYCYQGKCQAWQCAKDVDCPKGQNCNTQLYTCYQVATGCTSVSQCDDGSPCTTDSCELDGKCSHKPIGGCCVKDFDCDDKDSCTTDLCQAGKCAAKSIAGCCKNDAACDDGKGCTKDICATSGCQHIAAGLCCATDAECADNEPGNLDKCVAGQCSHPWPGLVSSCGVGSACTTNGCTTGTCGNGACTYPVPSKAGCCTTANQCNPFKKCVVGTCNGMTCGQQAVIGTGTHTWMPMDDGKMTGWTMTNSSKTVLFHQTSLTKVAGAGSLRYGIPNEISFEDKTPNKGSATSPAFALPAKGSLKFQVLLDVSPGAAIHQAGVDLVNPATGALLASLWSKNVQLQSGTTGGKWVEQTVPMGSGIAAGSQVALKFWFDQVKYDTSNKQKLGFAVDEVEVRGECL